MCTFASRWGGAGLAALFLLIAGDALVMRGGDLWNRFAGANGIEGVEPGSADSLRLTRLIEDRLALGRLRVLADEGSSVAVFGTSRAKWALRPELVSSPALAIQVAKFAHEHTYAAEIRAAAERVARASPDLVIFGISELDTHYRGLYRADSPFRSAAAFGEIGWVMGPRWSWQNRVSLQRTWIGDLLGSYRYRELLGHLGADRLRRFPGVDRPRAPDSEWIPFSAREIEVRGLIENAARSFPEDGPAPRRIALGHQIRLLREIAAGRHSEAQMELLRRSAAIVRRAGGALLVVELPVFPAARTLYPTQLRGEFLSFAHALAQDSGIRFLPLEEQPRYAESDFRDLNHLNASGARKLTAHVFQSAGVARSD